MRALRIVTYVVAGLIIGQGTLGLLKSSVNTTARHLASNTVMIVNEHGGGTGVILGSSTEQSQILTNRHVCEAIKEEGVVISDTSQKFRIYDYRESDAHDLCLVRVAGDLHGGVDVAETSPEMYSEATVSGHPHLVPTVITKGYFSHFVIIAVQISRRECTKDDLEGPNAFECLVTGGVAVTQNFKAQLVSALIQPGSSGSAIYNDQGELAGLVFAGAADLGYAYAVPLADIRQFLATELNTVEAKTTALSRGI